MGVFNIHAEKKRVLSAEGLTHTHLKNCEENFFPQHRPFRRTRRRRSLFLSSCDDARDGTHKLPRNYRVVRFFFAREEGFPPPTQRKLFEKRVFQQSGGSERKKKTDMFGVLSLESLESRRFVSWYFFRFSKVSAARTKKYSLSLRVFSLLFLLCFSSRLTWRIDRSATKNALFFPSSRAKEREREREGDGRYIHTYTYICFCSSFSIAWWRR